MKKRVWEKRSFRFQPQKIVDQYLGEKADWFDDGRTTGFSGCGTVESNTRTVRVACALTRGSLLRAMLTTSYLLTELNALSERDDAFLLLDVGCGERHPLHGTVSSAFRAGLASMTPQDLSRIRRNMRRAFVKITPSYLHRYASDCSIEVDAERQSFLFRCFGDACDMGIYPDSYAQQGKPARFSSHNLDYAYQQATLLAGFASLAERIRK